LLLHPFLAKISKMMISSVLLAEWMVSLVSSRGNRDQNPEDAYPEFNLWATPVPTVDWWHRY